MPLSDFLLDVAYGIGSKRVKFNDNEEDRISALPDSLIHHILSFLPSTKEAVQTGVLSKRWQYQWTRVPVLIFTDNSKYPFAPNEKYLKFVQHTLMLNECLKIKTFIFHYNALDPQFAGKILFATRRHVEKLYLNSRESFVLPTSVFNHASLVKFWISCCTFMPNGMVDWRCLSELSIFKGKLTDQAMKHILSGSPSLKSLDLFQSSFDKLVIASKSLKRLYLSHIRFSTINISCPSLEKLVLSVIIEDGDPDLFAQTIENIVSSSSLLESFELWYRGDTSLQLPKVVIASKSLKRLVLGKLGEFGPLEINCPKLEKLNYCDCLMFQTPKLVNLPSSLYATINIDVKLNIHMIKDILESLQNVKKLKFKSSFIKSVSDIAIKEGHCSLVPRLNAKCLVLDSYGLNEYHRAIACILDHSNALEELIIKVHDYEEDYDYDEKLIEFGENFWNSNTTLASHLKTIKIIGFPCRDHNRKLVMYFVQFLLNNAKVLEKMVVELKDKEYETTFILKVSQELLSLSKCSPHAKIEFYALSK